MARFLKLNIQNKKVLIGKVMYRYKKISFNCPGLAFYISKATVDLLTR